MKTHQTPTRMEIQLYNKNSLAGIPKRDLEISEALESRMINVIKEVELFPQFKNGIAAAYALGNWNAPAGVEFTVLVDQVMRLCKKYHGTLREKEITIAFTRGVLGEYGSFMHGLSIKCFLGFAKAHLAEESRLKLLAERNKPVEMKPEPTPEEQKEAFIQRLEILYIFHQTGKEILKTEGSFYFEKLYSSKVIRLTDDQRTKLKQKAYGRLTKAKNPALAKTKDQHDKMKQVYDTFLKAGIEGNDVKREAMYMGLIQWFKELAAFDLQIRDLII